MAVPGEGRICSASEAGCREYNGNQGNNSRILFTYGFEVDSEANDWEGGALSDASVVAGEQSFDLSGDRATNTLPILPTEGRAYNLKFLARAEGDQADLDIYFTNGTSTAPFQQVAVTQGEWRLYEVNLTSLDHSINYSESLVLEKNASADLYIDDFRLTEITDRYYLIKGSWQTPASCNEDIYGNPYELYMLGCEAYSNSQGETEYLHNFDSLCQSSAGGCEMMIDTHNYRSPESASSSDPDYYVPEDSFLYAVYDQDKECDSSSLGCERMGELQTYESQSLYRDAYIQNNPDQYQNILCRDEAVGCRAWSTEDQGESYFKDPGDQVCEWKQGQGEDESSWGWYQKKVSRCDTDSNGELGGSEAICRSSSDCEYLSSFGDSESDGDCNSGTGDYNKCVDGQCYRACIQEEEDEICATDISENMPPKTLGLGGPGNEVAQPYGYMDGGEWVGLCPAGQSGCTEYIDPASKFNPNLFDNRYANPTARIEPNTLYYDPNDNLVGEPYTYDLSYNTAGTADPDLRYYYGPHSQNDISGDQGDILRRSVTSYQIESEVDKSSC